MFLFLFFTGVTATIEASIKLLDVQGKGRYDEGCRSRRVTGICNQLNLRKRPPELNWMDL